MSQGLRQELRNFSWPYEAPRKQKPAVPASEHAKPPDILRDSLFWLVQKIADRCSPNKPLCDTNKLTKALQARLAGGELNLCNLGAEEKDFFEALTPEDFRQLHTATTLGGAIGIAYIEIEAELLGKILPGLQSLSNLDCISVWAPPEGGAIDFGFLKGAAGAPLRINILGTPAQPLKIIVLDGVKAEGKESQNRALQNSVLFTRDASGQVSAESTPLTLAHTPLQRADSLQTTPPNYLSIGLKALMRCGSFDASGKFGIDLKILSPEEVNLVQALGDPVWAALEQDAKRASLKLSWVQLHKDLRNDSSLMASLKNLSSSITISAPVLPRIEEAQRPAEGDADAASSETARTSQLDQLSLEDTVFDALRGAVRELMRRASFDAHGHLGIDLTAMSREQVRSLQSLGSDVWADLQVKAQKAGLKINWLRLPDELTISRTLVLGLKELKSLNSLSVATPARSVVLNLSQLQGSQIREVELRCEPGRKCAVIVPDGMKVRPSTGAGDADPTMLQSKVLFEKKGKVVREAPLFQLRPPPV